MVKFHAPPRLLFVPHAAVPEPNLLRFRMSTDDGGDPHLAGQAARGVAAHHGVGLDVDFPAIFGARHDAYERPLAGDAFRFARHDSIEAAWRTVQPLLDAPPPPEEYPPGI